jgi:hypothetical protein
MRHRLPFWSLLLLCLAAPVSADPLVLKAVDSGNYTRGGWSNPANENYIVGWDIDQIWRNFFVFDLSAIGSPISSATLRLASPLAAGTNQSFSLYDVSTPITELQTGGTNRTDIFSDLGTGALYASGLQVDALAPCAGCGVIFSISLNAEGLAYLNASLGQVVAFGGALPKPPGTPLLTNFLFDGTPWPGSVIGDVRELILTTSPPPLPVPEPSTLCLIAMGACAAALRRRRRT